MNPTIVDQASWQRARSDLLRREKAVTRELDSLARARQAMPWVLVEKSYRFQTDEGEVGLEALFGEHDQLVIYHFMFGPDWEDPCPGCSAWMAAYDGTADGLEAHNATLVAVSRAPRESIDRVRAARGWRFPWVTSLDDFNFDYHASAREGEETHVVGDEEIGFWKGENHGVSVFAKRDGAIYHTYSAYNRGIQQINGTYGYVDLLPYGGN